MTSPSPGPWTARWHEEAESWCVQDANGAVIAWCPATKQPAQAGANAALLARAWIGVD